MNRREFCLSSLVLLLACSAAPAQAEEPKIYKIGAILAMSGQASIYGTTMSQGFKLAVEEINAKGGVNGIPLEAVIEDHKGGGGQEGVNAMNRLLTIHGTKIVMTSFTAPTLAIAPIADQQKVFLLNGGGVSPKLVGSSKYIFHNRSLSSDLANGVLLHAKGLGLKKMAQIHWKNEAGDSVVNAAVPIWKKLGGEIVATEAVPQGATNMDTQIAKVRAANPDFIALWMFNPEVGLAVKRIREFGMKQPLIGIEYTQNDAKIAGNTGEGFVYVNDFFQPSEDQPWSKQFADGYKKKHGVDPDFYAANYYEGVYIIAELLKRARAKAGGSAQIGDYANGEAMKAALQENPKFDSVYGGQMVFQPNGVAFKRVALFKVEDGKGKFQKFLDLK